MDQSYPSCYRHPDRYTGARCQRCGHPVCGDCAVPAAVGYQCLDCVAQASRSVPHVRRRNVAATLRTAPTVGILLAINVVVWIAIVVTGGNSSRLVDNLAIHRVAYCSAGGRVYGAANQAVCEAAGGVYAPGLSDGAVWQLITSAFTHVSLLHIGFNMMALWFLGPQLEQFLGRVKFLVLYLGSALVASGFVFVLADPTSLTLGASGAVFGLMGALAVIVIKQRGNAREILFWIGANVCITIVGGAGISWQGHLGGLMGGVLIALALMRKWR